MIRLTREASEEELVSTKNGPGLAVVTGASAGVGRATARVFAERGASVGLLARGHGGLKVARKEIEAAGVGPRWSPRRLGR